MTMLLETQPKINTLDIPALIADCLTAAANTYQEFAAKCPNWTMTQAETEQVYLQTWGAEYGIDLVEAAAQIPTVDQFNTALLDDPDYADFLAQTASGIPMF